MSRAGSDARGVWGTTRDLHLRVAAHTKEMRALREAPEFLNFLAYAKSRDDAREREEARRASRRGAPARDDAGPAPPSNAASAPASAPPAREDPLLLLIETVDRAAATRGVPREGVWSEVGKPYRAGGGSAVADVARDVRDLFPRRVGPAGAKEPTTSDASAPPRPRIDAAPAAAAAADVDDDVPLREFLADAGYGRGVFAAARRTNEEGSSSEDEDEEEGDEGVLNGTPEASAEARSSPSSGPTPEASSSTNTNPPRGSLRLLPGDASFASSTRGAAAGRGSGRRADAARFPRERLRRCDARLKAARGGSKGTAASSAGGESAAEGSRSRVHLREEASFSSAPAARRGAGDPRAGPVEAWREQFAAVRERGDAALREALLARA